MANSKTPLEPAPIQPSQEDEQKVEGQEKVESQESSTEKKNRKLTVAVVILSILLALALLCITMPFFAFVTEGMLFSSQTFKSEPIEETLALGETTKTNGKLGIQVSSVEVIKGSELSGELSEKYEKKFADEEITKVTVRIENLDKKKSIDIDEYYMEGFYTTKLSCQDTNGVTRFAIVDYDDEEYMSEYISLAPGSATEKEYYFSTSTPTKIVYDLEEEAFFPKSYRYIWTVR